MMKTWQAALKRCNAEDRELIEEVILFSKNPRFKEFQGLMSILLTLGCAETLQEAYDKAKLCFPAPRKARRK